MAHASPATFLPVRSSFTTTPVQSSPSYLDVDRTRSAERGGNLIIGKQVDASYITFNTPLPNPNQNSWKIRVIDMSPMLPGLFRIEPRRFSKDCTRPLSSLMFHWVRLRETDLSPDNDNPLKQNNKRPVHKNT
ncbi:hypothetical protein OUZ56_009046 [Daphnia magna]|uniref:Uncharacterized protein n=1 Tax=Daphnia magna TaxID=35525 RepID=A0ABR0AEU8_9CRUS|nr:hypothetical protein OUZ56_009046 [Daphnia magna]